MGIAPVAALMVLGLLPLSPLQGQEAGSVSGTNLPARVGAVLGPDFEIDVELALMRGGTPEFEGLTFTGPGLEGTVAHLRPLGQGSMLARDIAFPSPSSVSVRVSAATGDENGLRAVLGFLTSAPDRYERLCGLVASGPVALDMDNYFSTTEGLALTSSARELNWLLRSSAGSGCRLELVLEIADLARLSSGVPLFNLRGGTLSFVFAPGSRVVHVDMVLSDGVVFRDGEMLFAFGSVSARLTMERVWLERFVRGILRPGDVGGLPRVLLPEVSGESVEVRGASVPAAWFFGSEWSSLYRLVTGQGTVSFGMNLSRGRGEDGLHVFRAHAVSPGLGDVVVVLGIDTVVDMAVRGFDLLFLDEGFAALARGMELPGGFGSMVRARVLAVVEDLWPGDEPLASGIERVLGGIDGWLVQSEAERMQVSFRPPAGSVEMTRLGDTLRGAPERFGLEVGLVTGVHATR